MARKPKGNVELSLGGKLDSLLKGSGQSTNLMYEMRRSTAGLSAEIRQELRVTGLGMLRKAIKVSNLRLDDLIRGGSKARWNTRVSDLMDFQNKLIMMLAVAEGAESESIKFSAEQLVALSGDNVRLTEMIQELEKEEMLLLAAAPKGEVIDVVAEPVGNALARYEALPDDDKAHIKESATCGACGNLNCTCGDEEEDA